MRVRGRVIWFFLLFLSASIYGQKHSEMAELYHFVDKADSLSYRSASTFYLEKFITDDYNYRERWRYTAENGNIVFFEVDFILDSVEYSEVYYLKRERLVCSEEYEKVSFSNHEDALRFGGVYYFVDAVPKHVAMLGRKTIQSQRSISPETLAIDRFRKRYSELRFHIPMLR